VRSITPGFALILALSVLSTAALLAAAVIYYRGSPARIASDYTSIASPANRALTTDLAAYTNDRHHRHLSAARSDLRTEVKTVAAFDDQLLQVTFPAAAQTAAGALAQAGHKLARLIDLQVREPSLRKMRSFDSRVEATATSVRTQAARIRHALGLPPSRGPLY